MNIILSLLGITLILGIFYLLSSNKKAINKALIIKALLLQLVFALFIVKIPIGRQLVEWISDIVSVALSYGSEGLVFVFGSLTADPSIFIVNVLAGIIFVATLIGILNYFGIIEFIVTVVGGGLSKLLGVEKNESMVAVSNIFLGQTEAPLLLGGNKLSKMTDSQLTLVLVSGMGSISASIIVAYANMSAGITMANLLTGCTLVPLSSIIISKLLVPETATPGEIDKEEAEIMVDLKLKKANGSLMNAISDSYMNAGQMVMAIAFSLVAIISLVALFNGILGNFGLSLEGIVSYIFRPFAFLMGAQGEQAVIISELLASKLITNEFVAFGSLAAVIDTFSPRMVAMSTVMLLGFANFASIGISLSGLSILAPNKKETLARLCPKAMIGGFAVSLLSALIVGLFI